MKSQDKVEDMKVVQRSIKADVFAQVICWALDVEKGRFDGSSAKENCQSP